MRALVTGAGIRVGRAIALAMADAGFDVVVHYRRSHAPAQDTAAAIRAKGRDAQLVCADLSTPEGCASLIAQSGAIDVLINSAAAWSPKPATELSLADWEAMQALNTRAPFLLSQGFHDALAGSQLDGGGCIVNLTDIAWDRPVPNYAHYTVSKAGLVALTRALALEWAPDIRVNAVSPGTVLVPEELDGPFRDRIRATIPAGRFGTARDVARTVAFLVASPYVTGQVWAVDGGRSVGGPMEAG